MLSILSSINYWHKFYVTDNNKNAQNRHLFQPSSCSHLDQSKCYITTMICFTKRNNLHQNTTLDFQISSHLFFLTLRSGHYYVCGASKETSLVIWQVGNSNSRLLTSSSMLFAENTFSKENSIKLNQHVLIIYSCFVHYQLKEIIQSEKDTTFDLIRLPV